MMTVTTNANTKTRRDIVGGVVVVVVVVVGDSILWMGCVGGSYGNDS
jgi:beta-lactamase regulating signal transducer with metallopeptidase domain